MTTHSRAAAGIGLPYAPQDSEMALGRLLVLRSTPLAAPHTIGLSARAFEAERHSYLAIPDEPDMAPAFSALARLRWLIEEEIERLIGVLDRIDGDTDFEQTATETRGFGFASDPSPDDSELCFDAENSLRLVAGRSGA